MNLLQQIEQEHVNKLSAGKTYPKFKAGDTVKVNVKVVEGDKERVQAFEGVVIGRKNRGINSSFRVRKMSYGEGVERVFALYSPNITVELVRQGRVRRAKLYYLRDRTGKSARIAQLNRRSVASNANANVGDAELVAGDVAGSSQSAAGKGTDASLAQNSATEYTDVSAAMATDASAASGATDTSAASEANVSVEPASEDVTN
jgi:large subunit ribosomal protein L19